MFRVVVLTLSAADDDDLHFESTCQANATLLDSSVACWASAACLAQYLRVYVQVSMHPQRAISDHPRAEVPAEHATLARPPLTATLSCKT